MTEKLNTKPNLHNYESVKGHNASSLPNVFEGLEIGDYHPQKRIKDRDGNFWYELNDEGDEDLPHYQVDQMFLIKMLKGIMPVSDMVCIKDKNGLNRFLSKEMPSFEFPTPKHKYDPILIREKDAYRNNDLQMTVEDFFLFYIFRDGDHFITYPKQHSSLYDLSSSGINTVAIYDFEGAASFWSKNPQFAGFEEGRTFQSLAPDTKKAITYYVEKLKRMYSGDGGFRHIAAILKNIEEQTGEKPWVLSLEEGRTPRTYQAELLKRLDELVIKIQ